MSEKQLQKKVQAPRNIPLPIPPVPLTTAEGAYTPDKGAYSLPNQLVGMKVSLDLTKEACFFIGPIELNRRNPTTEIPDGMPPQAYRVVGECLKKGILVKGAVKTLPEKDKSVIEEYISLVKKSGKGEKSLAKFRALLKRGEDRKWAAEEIALACLRVEENTLKRPDVIQTLTEIWEIAKSHPGHIRPYDDTEDSYTVTIKDGAVVSSTKTQDKKSEAVKPAEKTTEKTPEEALGKIFS